MQAWLQAMQARMSSARPVRALSGISGSAIIARVMPQASASPARDDPFGDLRLVDAAADEYRDRDPCLHRRGEGRDVGGADRHRRDDVDGAAIARRGAGDDVDVVEAAGRRQHRADVEHFAGIKRVGIAFVAGDAQADDERRSDAVADCGNKLGEKSHAVSERPAIAVVPQVDARIEELRRQIAVAGDDLAAVIAGRLVALSGGAIGGDEFLDHPQRQRYRRQVKALVGYG